MALRKVTPIKKDSPELALRGMLSHKLHSDSPEDKPAGECYHIYTDTDSPNTGNAISHLSEVYTFLSLASLSFRGVRVR